MKTKKCPTAVGLFVIYVLFTQSNAKERVQKIALKSYENKQKLPENAV